ncbi:nucleoside triphosphate pyrophosphohydrolase [Gilvimarinus sp. F26214L]|uniref:nucleoside triphosphate pyrophosphohydrolase n=1 Tax=Gilvimarinus sp. DZF01 TaxID=3461371 RepID=UPI004045A1F8
MKGERTEGKARAGIEDLLELMARLREPETGCPWDLEQDYGSIAPSTIEEAYEVVDAIERRDYAHLKEELGDLLFQVVFYAQLGREDGHFSFADIVQEITAKLLRRHPHVFPDGTLASRVGPDTPLSEAQVKAQWEKIKQEERSDKGQQGILADVPAALPSLTRAMKLQKRAALVGFDWPDAKGVLAKVREEIDELEAAMEGGDSRDMESELGDTLFSLINLARHLHLEPDSALRGCNRRFTDRFQFVEEALRAQGRSLEEASVEEMENLWQQAKQQAGL